VASRPDWSSLLALEDESDRTEAAELLLEDETGRTEAADSSAADGTASDKQVIPSGAEHELATNDLTPTLDDTPGPSSTILASGRSHTLNDGS
jgi:hypothetical protein